MRTYPRSEDTSRGAPRPRRSNGPRSGVVTRGLKAFRRDEQGVVALVFGIAALPVIALAGGAVDYNRAAVLRGELQGAVDAAVLAAASAPVTTDAARKAAADRIFAAQTGDIGSDVSLGPGEFSAGSGRYVYSVSAEIDTYFLGLVNLPALDVSVVAVSGRREGAVEISFVMDTSVSMSWDGSWDAALEGIGTVLDALDANTDAYASLVPMADRMRLPTSRAAWIKDAPADWDGCVEPREKARPGYPYAVDDKRPNGANRFEAYEGYTLPHTSGPYSVVCGREMVEPTQDLDEIRQAVTTLAPNGTGRYDVAQAWMWRLLSPRWATKWGKPRRNDARRIAVFFTDGRTAMYEMEAGGHGGHSDDSLGPNAGTQTGFEHLVRVCEEMRNDGIETHVIMTTDNMAFEPYGRACAGDPARFSLTSSPEEIRQAFANVSVGTSGIRLIE